MEKEAIQYEKVASQIPKAVIQEVVRHVPRYEIETVETTVETFVEVLDLHTVEKSKEVPQMEVIQQVEIEIKYEGYIQRQLNEIKKFKHLERVKIPVGFDFDAVHGLSNELKEKLSDIGPASLGQASRIDGMTPAALSVIMVGLKSGVSGNRNRKP